MRFDSPAAYISKQMNIAITSTDVRLMFSVLNVAPRRSRRYSAINARDAHTASRSGRFSRSSFCKTRSSAAIETALIIIGR